jgi:hypothetical protein
MKSQIHELQKNNFHFVSKKITLFVASLMLATSATKASEIINFSGTNLEFGTRFNQNEPIQFSERGIDFFVFPNGEFDFNTRPNDNGGDYYFKTAGRRSVEANRGNLENYGVRIERDNFGRIRRIGNTFINYDFQDRVSRIGTIFLKYNRFALIQIGGLQLVYNRFGELVNTFGSVKSRGYSGFTNTYYYGNGNNSNVYYRNNNNNSCNNDNFSDSNNFLNNEDLENDDTHYYYRADGTKAKIENKEEKNPEVKSEGRR